MDIASDIAVAGWSHDRAPRAPYVYLADWFDDADAFCECWVLVHRLDGEEWGEVLAASPDDVGAALAEARRFLAREAAGAQKRAARRAAAGTW